jgi:two-component system sensor histidine kinase YesM
LTHIYSVSLRHSNHNIFCCASAIHPTAKAEQAWFGLSGAISVTLREEILHTKSYTDILTDRHEGELEVSWDYAQEMEDVVCKRLILQPFIENAFYHGIRPASEEIKKYNSKGRIRIKIRQKAEEIIINITDNGKGMPKNKLNAIRSSLSKTEMPTEHIGIYNPHRRIVLTFGEKYGVNVYSLMNCGTTVQIRLPKFTF